MNSFDSIARPRSFGKNEAVFHVDQQANHLFKVVSGEVHLYRHSYEGKKILLFRAYDGDYFAEASLTSAVYHCTAVCMQPSTIEIFEANKVTAMLKKYPELASAWISRLSKELRSQRANVERLCLKSPVDKVIHYILTEGNPSGELLVNGTLSELAEIINISRETLYRTLAMMEKQELLERADGKLCLKNIVI